MDPIFKQRVENFLSAKNIAVAGYSSQKGQVANGLYDKFRKCGYKTFAINPKYHKINDLDCFADLKSVPEKIDAVMIATPPQASLELIKECIELGIKHVWIHKSGDNGSYDKEAVELAEKSGIEIIPMACPMMFLKPDPFHFCFKWILDWRGKLKIQNN
jgi:predicted CoA-binding protein